MDIGELKQQLNDQVKFLKNSAKLFDEGCFPEAKRLATTIRVLVHDTKSSKSLLSQLDKKMELLYWDNTFQNDSGALFGLVNIVLYTSPKYSPNLNPTPRNLTPFESWWAATVLEKQGGIPFSRKDIVLNLTNKDGGAHVDPVIENDYFDLSRKNMTGFEVARGGHKVDWFENPVQAAMRAIAHEMIGTLQDNHELLFGLEEQSTP